MSTLAARLRQLQVPDDQSPPTLPEMSTEELGQIVVDFGNSHRGKTFQFLWENEQVG